MDGIRWNSQVSGAGWSAISGEGKRDRQPSCRKEIDPEKQGVYTETSTERLSCREGFILEPERLSCHRKPAMEKVTVYHNPN